ncbi:hypothetical protein N0V88_006992 [Collariella sp. IMI 366227]|nr:hypothetical protein N0V88_006992 [Collariella sp. IMI 366227]
MSSRKWRKENQLREAEIKAMVSFMPHRPATEDWMLGRPMRKESRKAKASFGAGIRGNEFDKYNRSSDISLPLPGSIDSALSSDSDHVSYKVSAFDVLAPRPTLRCSTHPRSGTVPQDTGLLRRPSQHRRKLAAPIPEATLKAHKRVDNLADDLSASDLRELMERDQRRRARRRQMEQEAAEQRIARRAERQKAVDAEAQRQGRESPPNLERGILGREDVGLGLDPASAVVTSSRIRRSNDSPKQQADAPERSEHPIPPLASPPSKPSFHRKVSRSKSPQASVVRTERSDQPSKLSQSTTSRGPRSWVSFFKWGNRKHDYPGLPSFSNTSRDSMHATQTPTPPMVIPARRVSNAVPKRTMSRFREDLPELPISPPASRMQSPEAEATFDPHPIAEGKVPPLPPFPTRLDTRISTDQGSVEALRHTPSTFSHPDETGVSPEPQAMSLASIDSEGSWFSGRLSKKKRQSSGIMENASALRLPRQTPESDNDRHTPPEINNDDIYMTDDDYLARLAPVIGDRPARNRKSTGEARPSSDWGDEETRWGSVRQQPTVVRSNAVSRVKSREGLLKSFGEEGEVTVGRTSSSDTSDGGEELQRATSIDFGKAHARRISAGSAKILSITPRSSEWTNDAPQSTTSDIAAPKTSAIPVANHFTSVGGYLPWVFKYVLLTDYDGSTGRRFRGPWFLPKTFAVEKLLFEFNAICDFFITTAHRWAAGHLPDQEAWDFIGEKMGKIKGVEVWDVMSMLLYFRSRCKPVDIEERKKGWTGYIGVLQEMIDEVPTRGTDRLARKLSLDVNILLPKFCFDTIRGQYMAYKTRIIAKKHGIVLVGPRRK